MWDVCHGSISWPVYGPLVAELLALGLRLGLGDRLPHHDRRYGSREPPRCSTFPSALSSSAVPSTPNDGISGEQSSVRRLPLSRRARPFRLSATTRPRKKPVRTSKGVGVTAIVWGQPAKHTVCCGAYTLCWPSCAFPSRDGPATRSASRGSGTVSQSGASSHAPGAVSLSQSIGP